MSDDSTKQRKRGPSFGEMLTASRKAGLHVIGSCRHPDGSIELRYGETGESAARGNSHDTDAELEEFEARHRST